MKKHTLLLLAAVLMVSGCNKIEQGGGLYSRAKGEEVVFEAVNPRTDLQTKAAYSGVIDGSNVERIDWETDDAVWIHCAQIDEHVFKYKVRSITSSGSVSTAGLVPSDQTSVMAWGDPGDYTFFACSPAPAEASFTEGKILFELPQNQTGTRTADDGNISYKVNPDYMLMTAKTVVVKTSPDPAEAVDLSFLFLPTALEISLSGSTEGTAADAGVTVKEIELSSSTQNACLSGDFDADLNAQTSGSYPTISNLQNVSSNVKMSFGTGGESVPSGKSLTCTFMMCPYADLTDLTLKITMLDDGVEKVKKASLSDHGTPITLLKHKKTRLVGVMVPAGIQWTLVTGPSIDYWNGSAPVVVPVSPETEIGFSTFLSPWVNGSETGVLLEQDHGDGLGTSFSPWADGSGTGVTLVQDS